jgi:hypothetical protein
LYKFIVVSHLIPHLHSTRRHMDSITPEPNVIDVVTTLTRYWSDKPPNSTKIDRIRQITYFLNGDEPGAELVDVWALNTFKVLSKDNPYFWFTIPASYIGFFKRINFRLELLQNAAFRAKGDHQNNIGARRYLAHVDRVMDQFFHEVKKAWKRGIMDRHWRSVTMDHFFLVEWYAQRHSPGDVMAAVEEFGVGILNVSIEELGT